MKKRKMYLGMVLVLVVMGLFSSSLFAQDTINMVMVDPFSGPFMDRRRVGADRLPRPAAATRGIAGLTSADSRPRQAKSRVTAADLGREGAGT
jgi:hypothetical protein